jgi:hypothetical protein
VVDAVAGEETVSLASMVLVDLGPGCEHPPTRIGSSG